MIGTKKTSGFRYRTLQLAFFLGVLVIALCAATPLDIKIKLQKSTLPNGMTVVIVEDHDRPVVSYQTWIKAGSVNERPGILGASHMIEHLMFKGTKKFGPRQFFQILEAQGSEINAYATRDYTVFLEEFVSSMLPQVIELEADRLANIPPAVLTEEALKAEKMVSVEETRLRQEGTLDSRVQMALWQLAYRRHPYQWPVIGILQDIVGMSAQNAGAYFKAFFQPGNAIIVIVGDVDPVSTLAQVKKAYGHISGKPKPEQFIPNEPPQTEERRYVMHEPVPSESFTEAYHISAAQNPDSYALDVLANILFEGEGARAPRRLVDELHLVRTITGAAYTPLYPGLLMINASVREGVSVAQAQSELWKVIQEVQDKGVTDTELKTAIKQLSLQVLDSLRSQHGLGQLIGIVSSIFGDPNLFLDDLNRYSRVTAEDVKKVAVRYLDPNNRSVIVVVPTVQTPPAKTPKKARRN